MGFLFGIGFIVACLYKDTHIPLKHEIANWIVTEACAGQPELVSCAGKAFAAETQLADKDDLPADAAGAQSLAANAKPASGTSAPSKSPTLTTSPLPQPTASTTLTTPLIKRTFDLPRDFGRYGGMRHISVSPYDGTALLSAGPSSALADLSTGQILRQFHDLPKTSRCDLWIAQGKFVSVAEDNTVYTWETSRNASIAATFLKDTY